jgi:hypothetical protein
MKNIYLTSEDFDFSVYFGSHSLDSESRAAIIAATGAGSLPAEIENGIFKAEQFGDDMPDLSEWEEVFFKSSYFGAISIGYRKIVNNKVIINLTQHAASAEQVEDGVVEPTNKAAVQSAITFDAIPTVEEMAQRAGFLANIAKESGAKKAMIGGAPFFMSALERALIGSGITPVYAFSIRESVEKDGVKTSVFKHAGFVEV